MRKKSIPNNTPYPDHVIESVARCLLPDIIAAFNSDDGQKMFAEWKIEQEQDFNEKVKPPAA